MEMLKGCDFAHRIKNRGYEVFLKKREDEDDQCLWPALHQRLVHDITD